MAKSSNKKNGLVVVIIAIGIILFGIVAFVIVRSTATVVAIVPNQPISAGTRLTSTMLQQVRVPVNTPKGYITSMNSIVGQKLKISVYENQLLYTSNVMTSWDDFNADVEIPSDYIITAIQIPSNRAVGGLITVGDSVDIIGVPMDGADYEQMKSYLGEIGKNAYGAEGIHLYWVLSNVKILETDSSLAQNNQSSISNVTDNNGNSAYYVVALSYMDYEKLLLCQQYLQLWMNICPEYNQENGPMLDVMAQNVIQELKDSQNQSVLNDDGTIDESKINPVIPEKEKKNYNYNDQKVTAITTNENNEKIEPEITSSVTTK